MFDLSTLDAVRTAAVTTNNDLVIAQAATDSAKMLNRELQTVIENQRSLLATADTYANTASNIECLTNWEQPTNVGDKGGASSKVSGQFVMTPATETTPATFSARGAYPYNGGYFLTRFGKQAVLPTRFRIAVEFLLPTAADLAACQAVEFELQSNDGHQFWNMAWQADIADSKVWRVFNKAIAPQRWEPTSIPVKIVAGQWVTIVAQFIVIAGTVWHIGITIDGIYHPVMLSHSSVPEKCNSYLNAAWQLDCNGLKVPTPYVCNVRNYTPSWE